MQDFLIFYSVTAKYSRLLGYKAMPVSNPYASLPTVLKRGDITIIVETFMGH